MITKSFFRSLIIGTLFLAFALPASADTTISSDITTNQTWTTASSTYIISGNISINPGITLTINPGVVVKFAYAKTLTVNGTLNAQGTGTSSIYFTAYNDDSVGGDAGNNGSTTGSAGSWYSIKMNPSATATLTRVVVRYASDALYNTGGTFIVSDSLIATSSSSGLFHEKGTTTVTHSTFTGSSNNGVYTNPTATGKLSIDGSTISSNRYYGLYALGITALELTNNTFMNNNTTLAVNTGAAFVEYEYGGPTAFTHSGNTATGNGTNAIFVSGPIIAPVTWSGADTLPYYIYGSFVINAGKTLTLDAGAVVKFNSWGDLTVGGTLNVNGTPGNPAYFTSLNDDLLNDTNGTSLLPQRGDWVRLVFSSGSVGNITSAIIRYGGSNQYLGALSNYYGSTTLTNSTITSTKYIGVTNEGGTLTMASTTLFDNPIGLYHAGGTTNIDNRGNTIASSSSYGIYNNTFALFNAENIYWPATTTGALSTGPYHSTTNLLGNGARVASYYADKVDYTPWIVPISGAITTNTTWSASSTYIVDGTVTVNTGVTLKIKEGTVVKFKTPTSGLVVNGTLSADAAASSSKIYFTSSNDDAVGGDTNGDGGASTPAAGDWDGVKVNSGAFASTSYAVIRYGGYAGSGGSSKMLWNNGGTLNLYNSEIAMSSSYGVFTNSGTTLIIWADLHANTYGACVTGGNFSIGSSAIYNNSSYGVCNSTFSSINAKHNYWGISTGPYHATLNPTGGGNPVSNLVTFTPWLTQMHYLYSNGNQIITSVDGGSINWDWYNGSTTAYTSAWYGAVNTWTKGGAIAVATDTIFTTLDLEIQDINSSSASDWFVANYDPNENPDRLRFNKYFMDQYGSAQQQNAATHELGHALGLGHSYVGNIMNSYSTTQIATGTQDKSDYDYCWISAFCVP